MRREVREDAAGAGPRGDRERGRRRVGGEGCGAGVRARVFAGVVGRRELEN